jgi:hypothetical protein
MASRAKGVSVAVGEINGRLMEMRLPRASNKMNKTKIQIQVDETPMRGSNKKNKIQIQIKETLMRVSNKINKSSSTKPPCE